MLSRILGISAKINVKLCYPSIRSDVFEGGELNSFYACPSANFDL